MLNFLVDRKFPGLIRIRRANQWPGWESGLSPTEKTELLADVDAYRSELRALPEQELIRRYEAQKAVESEARREAAAVAKKHAAAAAEKEQTFFDQPDAIADLDHWAKVAYWTLDEAVALSFDKAPEKVNLKTIRPLEHVRAFAKAYLRRVDLVQRAKTLNQLYDPALPGFFVAWAKRNGIEVPERLEAALVAHGVQIDDWKTLYDRARDRAEELSKANDTLATENADLQAKLRAVSDELANRAASQDAAKPRPASSFSKEMATLQKLAIGMAVAGYGYDPKATRSEKVAEIANDLRLQGLNVDADTIRRWLRKISAEMLSPEAPK